jgi:hypothetical protein
VVGRFFECKEDIQCGKSLAIPQIILQTTIFILEWNQVKAVCVKKPSSGILPWICLSGLIVDTSYKKIRNIEKCYININNLGKSLLQIH